MSKELTQRDKKIKVICETLESIIEDNRENSGNREDLVIPAFDSKSQPPISIYHYLRRLIKYAEIEDSTLILTLIYIDKLSQYTGVPLTDYNVHK